MNKKNNWKFSGLIKRGHDNYLLKLSIELILFALSSQVAPLYLGFLALLWWWDLQPFGVIQFFAMLPIIMGVTKVIFIIISHYVYPIF